MLKIHGKTTNKFDQKNIRGMRLKSPKILKNDKYKTNTNTTSGNPHQDLEEKYLESTE